MVSVDVKHHVYLLTDFTSIPPSRALLPVPNKPYGFCGRSAPCLLTYALPCNVSIVNVTVREGPTTSDLCDVYVFECVCSCVDVVYINIEKRILALLFLQLELLMVAGVMVADVDRASDTRQLL